MFFIVQNLQGVSMSKLLVNEYPLIVLPTLAAKIGLNEAIMLQQIHYWINLPKAIEKHGRRWHYDKYENWQLQFPFWSLSTIKRISKRLRELKVVIAKPLGSKSTDQTLWYTIDYKELTKIELTITCAKVCE